MESGRRVLLALVGLQLAHGLLYTLLIPLWQNPDELSHFEYVELFAQGGAIRLDLPLQESRAYRVLTTLGYRDSTPGTELTHSTLRTKITESLARHRFWEIRPAADRLDPFRNRELDQPPLYYFVAAQVIRWLRLGSLDGDAYALRLMNVVFALGVVAIAYRVGGELFPDRPVLAIAPAAFIAGLPQYAALSASVTNDKLVDLILGGHLHIVTDPPKLIPNDDKGHHTVLVHSGAFAKFVGRLDVVVRVGDNNADPERRSRITSFTFENIPIDSKMCGDVPCIPEDPAVADLMWPYSVKINQEIDLNTGEMGLNAGVGVNGGHVLRERGAERGDRGVDSGRVDARHACHNLGVVSKRLRGVRVERIVVTTTFYACRAEGALCG